ncbi:MAG: zinc ABC transporter substrate-binding protein [Chlamydiales bacterium]|nr:zinc ABC transporter substrate-binding protein [Chlamydiales bacterium]
MKKNPPLSFLVKALYFLSLFVLCMGWEKRETSQDESSKTVLVSIAPYAFFVEKIAGDTLEVATLIPEGANPHIYEPKPQEVERSRNADLWIRLGESFDQKVLKTLREQNPNMRIADVTQGITLLHECSHSGCSHEGEDIHIWLSPVLAQIQAKTIANSLIAIAPEHTQLYENNLALFLKELEDLHIQIAQILAPYRGSAVLVSHPAFAYFCDDYGILQLSVEMEGKEPRPQDVTQLLKMAREYEVQLVILEPQYSNKGAELIARELGVPTKTLDPYSQNYLDNLRLIAQTMAYP